MFIIDVKEGEGDELFYEKVEDYFSLMIGDWIVKSVLSF